ncbi:MAG: hypothetical protein AB201_02595 [Parcubacteria bacterium C7867-006]|nr:MAG: hypothetical protein AB201_02595 [Parcubacteria bacterium C7867-006]
MDKLSWNTIEYLHQEKTADWYWIVSIVSVSIAIISIIMNNVIFAILVIVSSFTLMLFASKKPSEVEVDIDDMGIRVGNILYPYRNLDSFWVETREFNDRILLKSKKIFMPLIIIFIEEAQVRPADVRALLIKHLPEEEHSEPFLEKLLVYLGF